MFGLFKPKGMAAVTKSQELLKQGKLMPALELALVGARTAPGGWEVASHILFQLGRYPEALEAAEQALESNLPELGQAAAWNAKGQALVKLGRVAEARTCFPPCLVEPRQAMRLAALLAHSGSPDVPGRGGRASLRAAGVNAWFPAEPRLERGPGGSVYSLQTLEFTYTLGCQGITPEAAKLLREDTAEGNLLSGYERFLLDGFQATMLVPVLGDSVPQLDYLAAHGSKDHFLVGRFWVDLGKSRFVYAHVAMQDASHGARPELGRFLDVDLNG